MHIKTAIAYLDVHRTKKNVVQQNTPVCVYTFWKV